MKSITHLIGRTLSLLGLAFVCTGIHARAQQTEDARPVVDASTVPLQTAGNPSLPTLYLVGDSTLHSSAPLRGWAQEMPPFFDTTKINIVDRALGGRSSRTYQTEGRWDKVVADLKSGDFVIVQFGHNDAGRYDDPKAKGRPSLPGEGEDTANVTKPDGTTETVHSFGWYMRKYCTDAKAKGAHVILCSMVAHKMWDGDKIKRGEKDSFVKWTADAASATGADFIDLNALSAAAYEKLGPAAVDPLFADPRTHSSPAGAALNAQNVVSGLRSLAGAPLDPYLSDKGKAVAAADPQYVVSAGSAPAPAPGASPNAGTTATPVPATPPQ